MKRMVKVKEDTPFQEWGKLSNLITRSLEFLLLFSIFFIFFFLFDQRKRLTRGTDSDPTDLWSSRLWGRQILSETITVTCSPRT